MFGISEGFLILIVVVILFGAASIPKIARSLGKAKSEFQKGLKEGEEEVKETEVNEIDKVVKENKVNET